MNNKKLLLTVFAVVALVQLYVPAKMIWNREVILKSGTEYKFKTAPIDPSDPFRGKYITLSFEENTVQIYNETHWTSGEQIFVYLTTDKDGFAKIKSVSKEKPENDQEFLKAKVGFVTGDRPNNLTINYPFDRFYMEESKAPEAELMYQESQQDLNKITYALVSIKNGYAVLKDVLIDGVSISEIVNITREGVKK